MNTDFALIIPAAGEGRRLGENVSKAFVDIAGIEMVVRTLSCFSSFKHIRQRIIAVQNRDMALARRLLPDCLVVEGGERRQDSVAAALTDVQCHFVAIHDAARPFAAPQVIDAVLRKAVETGAAIAALPVTDTIKRADTDGLIAETVDRSVLWNAQTPQAFRTELLRRAFEFAALGGITATDDSQLVEKLPHAVHLVTGNRDNIKITTPEDLAWARLCFAGSSQEA